MAITPAQRNDFIQAVREANQLRDLPQRSKNTDCAQKRDVVVVDEEQAREKVDIAVKTTVDDVKSPIEVYQEQNKQQSQKNNIAGVNTSA